MKIAIIGAGRVGVALGSRWAVLGHQVVFGVRDAGSDSAKSAAAQAPHAQITSVESAAESADLVLLALPAGAMLETVAQLGPLTGKILVDAANWFGARPPDVERSITEAVAAVAPGARVVKAFNTTGTGNMLEPRYGQQRADMYIAGDDAEAKQAVAELAVGIGFDVVDVGPLAASALLESLAQLWVHLAYGRGMGTDIAWKLLKR